MIVSKRALLGGGGGVVHICSGSVLPPSYEFSFIARGIEHMFLGVGSNIFFYIRLKLFITVGHINQLQIKKRWALFFSYLDENCVHSKS